ncbi:MAG TPA: sensor histidine kinase, partial [Acidimicrobiales bacterium]|jgi:signal transduction histidine kinase
VVAILTGAGAVVYGMAILPDPPVLFGPLLGIYTLAAHRPRRITVPFALVAMVVAGLSIPLGDDSDAADVAVAYFSAVTAWVVGDTTRSQRERAAWLESRRADEVLQAAADERVRIARELHDVVAHHVSVIAVQAEAAQEVVAARPDQAADAMGKVADTARSAMGELRRLVGVLRTPADLAPQPDLAAVDELVDSVRQAGLAVELSRSGQPRPVDAIVGLTAYRVVQEALTNVLKHAGRGPATVELEFGDDALVITVSDDGVAAAGRNARRSHSPAGQGLVGMRERVATLGGSLEAGPRPGGGFAVRARLPLVS